jgi:DNA-binding NarL/FixJ family response regulator
MTDQLTEREYEVLYYLSKGQLNKEIAYELNITEKVVKQRLTKIFKKLGAGNRLEVLLIAVKKGIIKL